MPTSVTRQFCPRQLPAQFFASCAHVSHSSSFAHLSCSFVSQSSTARQDGGTGKAFVFVLSSSSSRNAARKLSATTHLATADDFGVTTNHPLSLVPHHGVTMRFKLSIDQPQPRFLTQGVISVRFTYLDICKRSELFSGVVPRAFVIFLLSGAGKFFSFISEIRWWGRYKKTLSRLYGGVKVKKWHALISLISISIKI